MPGMQFIGQGQPSIGGVTRGCLVRFAIRSSTSIVAWLFISGLLCNYLCVEPFDILSN